MEQEPLSHEQLEKLEKNPAYKLSAKQQALLAQYRAGKFKNNPSFAKHPTNLEESPNARERKDDGKEPDSN